MTTVIDTAALFYAYLAAQSSLVSEITVNGKLNLYGPPGLPDAWELQKALVFLRQPSRTDLDLPISYEMMQVRCYGPTAAQATNVFRVLKPLLHRRGVQPITLKGGARGLLQFAQIVSGPTDMYETDLKWPFVMSIFEVHIGEWTLP